MGYRNGIYLMNQCFPTGEILLHSQMVDESRIIQIAPMIGSEAYVLEDPPNSEVTYWLAHLLRGLSVVPCKVDGTEKNDCKVCEVIRNYRLQQSENCYVDGWSLHLHEQHLTPDYGYKTKGISNKTPQNVKLAYYHPEGVDFRIFPYGKKGEIHYIVCILLWR